MSPHSAGFSGLTIATTLVVLGIAIGAASAVSPLVAFAGQRDELLKEPPWP